MLDGAEQHQFHQFVVAPPIRTTLPLHLSFSLHAASSTPNDTTSFLLPFDPYNNYPSHSQSHHHHHHHHHQHQLPLQTNNLLHHHHHSPPPPPPHNNKDQDKELPNRTFSSSAIEIRDDDHQRQLPACASIDDSWSNDEVLAMLRIRSSMENWFPELTWDHVSRKLAELGFKKSAEKCKEKFEDENCRYFIHDMINYGKNINNNNNNNNYRFVGELEEEVYIQNPADHDDPGDDGVVIAEEKEKTQQQQLIGNSRDVIDTTDHDDVAVRTKQRVIMENKKKKKSSRESRKRKRRERLEVFKCFCEGVVKQMMAQQEEIHRRLLQDMLKRDEEKLAREEAWKRQEMERVDKELDLMAQEQAIAGDRQATIIEFLKNYVATRIQNSKKSSSCSPILHSQNFRNPPEPTPSSNVNFLDHQTTTTPLPPTCQNNNSANFPIIKLAGTPATLAAENPGSISSDTVLLQQVPSSANSSPANDNQPVESNSRCTPGGVDVAGRRWPRDEVMALINLRCSLNNSINSANNVVVEDHEQHQKELGSSSSSSSNKIKGSSSSGTTPVWERISEGMRGMGYNRSAKRCKEKWENINKYFRKTKDNNNVNRRKRSLDSRTCPYFHQLTSLYNTTHHGNQLAAASAPAPQSHIQSPVNHCDSTAISGQIVPPDHHAPS